MNRVKIILLVSIFNTVLFSSFFLPDDVKIKIGSGYNSNFLRFSNYELNISSNNMLILGDSDTFDSPILRYAVSTSSELDFIPITIELNLGVVDFTQSQNKTTLSSNLILSHRLGNYKWIKFGYKNIPNNYLRMYKDRDQIGSPLLSADYSFERFYSSISLPIYEKIWLRAQINRSSIYFNPYFTEFDLLQNQLVLKIYNIEFRAFNFSPFAMISNAENSTYNSGLFSNQTDRSYAEYAIGTDVKIENKTIFFNDYKAILSFKLREYISSDLIDILHNNRSHMEFEFINKINKQIYDNVSMSMYCKYTNRNTNALSEYIEDLKSYKNFELGFDLVLNLTDKLYDFTY